jgi:hypothetical protein
MTTKKLANVILKIRKAALEKIKLGKFKHAEGMEIAIQILKTAGKIKD